MDAGDAPPNLLVVKVVVLDLARGEGSFHARRQAVLREDGVAGVFPDVPGEGPHAPVGPGEVEEVVCEGEHLLAGEHLADEGVADAHQHADGQVRGRVVAQDDPAPARQLRNQLGPERLLQDGLDGGAHLLHSGPEVVLEDRRVLIRVPLLPWPPGDNPEGAGGGQAASLGGALVLPLDLAQLGQAIPCIGARCLRGRPRPRRLLRGGPRGLPVPERAMRRGRSTPSSRFVHDHGFRARPAGPDRRPRQQVCFNGRVLHEWLEQLPEALPEHEPVASLARREGVLDLQVPELRCRLVRDPAHVGREHQSAPPREPRAMVEQLRPAGGRDAGHGRGQ
mmetsp:Transcript_50613/g.159341  ORF Transcript_50613/g.159341 Transcript_50613/m.159341 type:complete len:336 (-) Transcript_50613:89-1096(-)